MHPCEPLQCPPPFALGVLGSVYTTTVLMPLLVTLGCWLGCAIQSSRLWQSSAASGDNRGGRERLVSEPSAGRSNNVRTMSATSSDAEHIEVVQQEAQEWAASRSLRSPETERLDSLRDRPAASDLDSDSGGEETQGTLPGIDSESGEDEGDTGFTEAINEDENGSRSCCCFRNCGESFKLDPPGSIEKRHALYALLPSCCVVAPGATDRAKSHGWRCAGLIYQFCWLPISRSALAVVLPRSSPWDPRSSPWDPNVKETLLLQGDPSVEFFAKPEAKCAWVFGACVLLCLGIGIPDMVVCWACWRAQPGHDTDDAIHPARTLHPALVPELYRPGWAAGVWFVLDVMRKFSLVLCALAADGSSTPFDLPRWYVPGQTPAVTILLLSLVTLAVCQPYRHLQHQCHEAVSLACLALVAQTADSTFAGWAALGMTLVITLQIYRRHRSTTINPLGLAIDACKQARWRRTDRYEQLQSNTASNREIEAEAEAEAETEEAEAEAEAETRCREGLGLANDEEDAAVVNKESGGKKRGEPRVPAGSVGLKAVV